MRLNTRFEPKRLEEGHAIMCGMSRALGIHRPRTKYLDVAKANMAYVKQRRHNRKQTKKLIRRQLCLLGKILQEIRRMQREHYDEENRNPLHLLRHPCGEPGGTSRQSARETASCITGHHTFSYSFFAWGL